MHRSPKVSKVSRVPRLALCSCLILALAAPAASAKEEESVTYTKEGQQAYEQQLAAGEIREATINKRLRRMRMTLKDGRHVFYRYPPKGEPAVAAQLKAKHVPVTVLTPAQAKREASKIPRHHKIRYIAGGVLVAVILIVGAVLLINRRRKYAME
jgi:hypothetical protein